MEWHKGCLYTGQEARENAKETETMELRKGNLTLDVGYHNDDGAVSIQISIDNEKAETRTTIRLLAVESIALGSALKAMGNDLM